MPTEKPRVMVTLSQEVFDLLTDTSEATGKSKSALCAEILESQRFSLKLLAKAHRAIKKPSKQGSKVVNDLEDERDFLEKQGDILGSK